MTSLKHKTISGLFWSFSERIGYQLAQFIVAIILARLLMPHDFGLIGMLMIFIAVSNSLIDSGFGSALIQKKKVTHTDYSTIFYFNILVAIVLYLILFLTAPLIAAFYGETKLIGLVRFLGLGLVINSFSLIQNTLLTKKIDFKNQMKATLISIILSGMIGIYMAYRGFGVWSLAVQVVSGYLFRGICLWILNTWRPTFEFSFSSMKSLFSFGSKLLISGLIETIFQNIYLLIIGRFFSAGDLGYYTRAKRTQELPTQSLTSTIQKVTYPIFCSIQDDNRRLKRGYREVIKVTVFINAPLMLGLMVVAEPLVRVLLTEKWLPSVIYLQILCLSGILYPLHAINLNILKVKGRSDLFLRLEILKKILIVTAILIGLKWGILGLVIGSVVVSFLAYLFNSYYSGKMIDYSAKEQVSDVLPYFLIAILMAIMTHLVGHFFNGWHLIKLCIQVVSATSFYYIVSKIMKFDVLKNLVIILKDNILPKIKVAFNVR